MANIAILGMISMMMMAVVVMSSGDHLAASCMSVDTKLVSCVSYVESEKSENPPSACCSGVKAIVAEATTKKDRVKLCNCLQQAVEKLGDQIIPDKITGLPKACGVSFDMPPIADKNFNCSTISFAV
ncbi:non-specific lipid-transfer protein 1-like [Andrographis paniculata]|uniref:non-specific lipid-transfer protein 1-like n=1 Tax=Andrographis paniculata TaxID=175694 RepID=UPI0021E96106|nr:non-specific lipid-transfer protein 1-like [Andrographis paniculata]